MLTTAPTDRAMHDLVHTIPLTQEVWLRLERERDALSVQLASPVAVSPLDRVSEDEAVPSPPELWDRQQLARRLDTLQEVLQRARVVIPDGTAVVGSQVVVQDEDGVLDTFLLVVPGEASSRAGRISIDSPLGRVLLGRRVGDVAEVSAPDGVWAVTVVQVSVRRLPGAARWLRTSRSNRQPVQRCTGCTRQRRLKLLRLGRPTRPLASV
jgi:transcription elongation GreA/GreB family factor